MTAWSFGDSVDELVGITLAGARARADELGLQFRDLDAPVAAVMNATTGRVNVHSEHGVVTSAVIV